MANAIPIRVAGNGTSVLNYELPANLLQFVQSVNAVIDNSSGGVTQPTLTVLDSTNEVIADVPQGRSIPAGDSARATWARRLVAEQPPPASGGSYIFVAEHNIAGDALTFSPIPQDARHLVVFLSALGGALRMIWNNDGGANYAYLTDALQNDNGVQTFVQASNIPSSFIGLEALASDGDFFGRAVITIPDYRLRVSGADRACEIEAWQHWRNPITPRELYRHVKIAGFWNDPAYTSTGPHPITSIRLSALSGVAGKASLYKIV